MGSCGGGDAEAENANSKEELLRTTEGPEEDFIRSVNKGEGRRFVFPTHQWGGPLWDIWSTNKRSLSVVLAWAGFSTVARTRGELLPPWAFLISWFPTGSRLTSLEVDTGEKGGRAGRV